MTAKEKALELCVKFFEPSIFEYEKKQYFEEMAKQCALICVDEMLEECLDIKESYWHEVKEEIIKL